MLKFKIYLILILIIYACSPSRRAVPCKQCPQYSIEKLIISDTFTFNIPHYNINYICYPSYDFNIIENDTLYIEIFQ